MKLEFEDSSVHKMQVIHKVANSVQMDTLKFNAYISKDANSFEIHLQVTVKTNSIDKSYDPHSMYTIFFCQTNRYKWFDGVSSKEASETALYSGINAVIADAKTTLKNLTDMVGLRKMPDVKYLLTELTKDQIDIRVGEETIRFSNSFFKDSQTTTRTFSG